MMPVTLKAYGAEGTCCEYDAERFVRMLWLGNRLGGCDCWKEDAEGRAMARPALHRNAAAVGPNNAQHRRQPQPFVR